MPLGPTTTTISGFPSFPNLKLGDPVSVYKNLRNNGRTLVTGEIRRFFHHNHLNRNEIRIETIDIERKRYYVTEQELINHYKNDEL